MNITNLLNVQMVLFICMEIGFLLGKLGQVTPQGRLELTDLVMNVTLPAQIVSSFLAQEFSEDLMDQSIAALVIMSIGQVAAVVLGPVLFPASRFNPEDRKILRYSLINTNAAFIGMPILGGLLGDTGTLLASVAMIPLRITLWTAGISLFVEEKDFSKKVKKIVLHPCMVAVYVGLVLMLAPWTPPKFFTQTLSTVGSGTTFLSMLIVGFVISQMDLHRLITPTVAYYSFLRLLGVSLVMLGVQKLLGVDPAVTAVTVVLSGTPAGAFTAMMAAKYHSNEPLAGRVVLVTTLLSNLTLPLLCMLI